MSRRIGIFTKCLAIALAMVMGQGQRVSAKVIGAADYKGFSQNANYKMPIDDAYDTFWGVNKKAEHLTDTLEKIKERSNLWAQKYVTSPDQKAVKEAAYKTILKARGLDEAPTASAMTLTEAAAVLKISDMSELDKDELDSRRNTALSRATTSPAKEKVKSAYDLLLNHINNPGSSTSGSTTTSSTVEDLKLKNAYKLLGITDKNASIGTIRFKKETMLRGATTTKKDEINRAFTLIEQSRSAIDPTPQTDDALDQLKLKNALDNAYKLFTPLSNTDTMPTIEAKKTSLLRAAKIPQKRDEINKAFDVIKKSRSNTIPPAPTPPPGTTTSQITYKSTTTGETYTGEKAWQEWAEDYNKILTEWTEKVDKFYNDCNEQIAAGADSVAIKQKVDELHAKVEKYTNFKKSLEEKGLTSERLREAQGKLLEHKPEIEATRGVAKSRSTAQKEKITRHQAISSTSSDLETSESIVTGNTYE